MVVGGVEWSKKILGVAGVCGGGAIPKKWVYTIYAFHI